MTGLELSASAHVGGELLAERLRQVEREGWSLSHDDEHAPGALAGAAGNYAINAADQLDTARDGLSGIGPPEEESWPGWIWKPKSPRRDLVRAGALIIAEIERLDRAAQDLSMTHGGEPCSRTNSAPSKKPSAT